MRALVSLHRVAVKSLWRCFAVHFVCFVLENLLLDLDKDRLVLRACDIHRQVMDGEDKIVESMRRFANDAKCVEYLKTFKD